MNSRLNVMVSEKSPRGCGDNTVAAARVRRRSARSGLLLAALAACLCGPVTAAWAAPAGAPIAQSSGASPSTQPSHVDSKGADSAYAQREVASKDLENFKGGEPVVIVTSTAVLIVAIIILILLI